MTRPAQTPAHKLRRKPPFFSPVPLRARRDGWTIERQCGFLAHLYVTGSVGLAAARVGMSRNSAYRLRMREGAQEFAAAWDHVLTAPGTGRIARPRPDLRKVTDMTLFRHVEQGLVKPLLYRGAVCAIRRKPCNSELLHLLARHDAVARRVERGCADGS